MSTAEPFMPAHEAKPQAPDTERDIDGDVDVLFGEVDPDQGPIPVDHEAPSLFHTPVPGDALTEAELEDDLEA
ncbi:hypothetical protein GCM10009775_17480 [Microbacterium aoyamense]|uniref:Uncharacterized protein n=1 Tax=Microbacterium aoyamense TaxID=344166 RepID=A0ABP5B0X0_9MICO|nr:hypothetical protein [Microbacterium aoyamense]